MRYTIILVMSFLGFSVSAASSDCGSEIRSLSQSKVDLATLNQALKSAPTGSRPSRYVLLAATGANGVGVLRLVDLANGTVKEYKMNSGVPANVMNEKGVTSDKATQTGAMSLYLTEDPKSSAYTKRYSQISATPLGLLKSKLNGKEQNLVACGEKLKNAPTGSSNICLSNEDMTDLRETLANEQESSPSTARPDVLMYVHFGPVKGTWTNAELCKAITAAKTGNSSSPGSSGGGAASDTGAVQ